MVILHLAPVVCSTISMWFAVDQWFFLRIFMKKDVAIHSHHFLTSYWKTFVDAGVPIVLFNIFGTATTTATLLLTEDKDLLLEKGSYYWYMASSVLALSHLAFVPKIFPIIRDLQNGGLHPALGRWLAVHNTRSLTVDLACWIACLVASAKTLTV